MALSQALTKITHCKPALPAGGLPIAHSHRGQSLVELVLAFGLAAILLPAVLTGFVASREGKAQQQQRLQALTILKENEEATRSVRQRGWVAFAVDGTYYATISGAPSWSLVSGVATTSGFTRSITISSVNRDVSGIIVASGGTPDPSTKKIYTKVSWDTPILSHVDSTSYLTRYLDNASFVDTTQEDFNKGQTSSVKIQLTPDSFFDDGEIVLSQTGGYGDWCNPAGPIAQFNLSGQGIPNAVSATFYTDSNNSANNKAIIAAAEGGNASGVTLATVNVTDPSHPNAPVPSLGGTVSNTPPIKTNGVFNEIDVVNDISYGYLAADQHGKASQGIIVNLSNYSEVGTLDLGTNADGKSIYVSNNLAYLTTSDSKLYIFDLNTSHSGSHSPTLGGNVNLAGIGNKIIVVGTMAFVATSSTTSQLQIVDVSDKNNPQIISGGNINLGNGKGATDLYVTAANQTPLRAYVVTAAASPDFFTVNINPNDGTPYKHIVATYATTNGMNPTGVVAVSAFKGIIVGTGSTKNYQVISLSEAYPSPPALSQCGSGGLTTTYNINGVATLFTPVAQRAYSYIITDDSSHELKILEGGPGAGNGNFTQTGTFTSRAFGPSTLNAAYNRFAATISQPLPNEVQILVGVADTVVGGSCPSSYTFRGINGTAIPFTSDAYGTAIISGGISLGSIPANYLNPGKCFKYQVTLYTSNPTLTPKFKDMTVNYSP